VAAAERSERLTGCLTPPKKQKKRRENKTLRFLKALGRITFFALFRIYLIIPIAYTVVLLIVLAAFGSGPADYPILLPIGVLICCLLSALLALRRKFLSPKDPKRMDDRQNRKGEYAAPKNENPSVGDSAPDAPLKGAWGSAEKQPFIPPEAWTPKPENDKPKLYRTRRDPDLFIMAYHDRLEFYRRDEYGYLQLERTEFKN